MLRCFPLPSRAYPSQEQSSVGQWCEENREQKVNLHVDEQQALARLVPLLLCGEQSAVLVFNTENQRLLACEQQSLTYLSDIEADERAHEEALQLLCAKLPQPQGLHQIKRKAQRFYARIAQETSSIAEHFATIAALDRCVSILMHTVARSSIQGSSAATLFELIKKDEARHVRIAQQHCLYLQTELTAPVHAVPWIEGELVTLLKSQKSAFEALDIDSALLFERLLSARKTSPVKEDIR